MTDTLDQLRAMLDPTTTDQEATSVPMLSEEVAAEVEERIREALAGKREPVGA